MHEHNKHWGAIFDWDGVIIDSSRHHEESWERLARENQLQLVEGHFIKGFGMKNDVIIPEILGWTHDPDQILRLSLRKEEIYREIVREWGIDALPGVRPLLDFLRAEQVPRAIGSSTHRLNITTTLDVLGLADLFETIVSAEDVSRGKPDPQVFLIAAERINVPPSRCVVFEDALVGIEAASRAGMRSIAVATTNPLAEIAHADLAVQSLADLHHENLGALWKSRAA